MTTRTKKPESPAVPTAPGPYDPDPPARAAEAAPAGKPARASVLKVLTLDDVLSYEPPPGSLLVGDGVIEAGGVALLYGPPGSFKGFAVGHLMACGARGGGTWLGHEVRERFASLWINCENGRRRLRNQFERMDLPPDARDYLFNTDIPDVWSVADPHFVEELRATVTARQIKLVIVDTVSNFTADELAKDFAAFFAGIHAALAVIPWKVAVLLVHHARKPKEGDRSARGLLHTISGHQTLQRRSRCILYMGRVTDELDEKRVVAVCLKCSDSAEAEGRKVAVQLNGKSELEELTEFDWNEWAAGSAGSGKKGRAVTLEHLREIFDNGEKWLRRSEAAAALMEAADVGRSAAYDALKKDGPFANWLRENPATGAISVQGEEG
jgi:hypothetical protein